MDAVGYSTGRTWGTTVVRFARSAISLAFSARSAVSALMRQSQPHGRFAGGGRASLRPVGLVLVARKKSINAEIAEKASDWRFARRVAGPASNFIWRAAVSTRGNLRTRAGNWLVRNRMRSSRHGWPTQKTQQPSGLTLRRASVLLGLWLSPSRKGPGPRAAQRARAALPWNRSYHRVPSIGRRSGPGYIVIGVVPWKHCTRLHRLRAFGFDRLSQMY